LNSKSPIALAFFVSPRLQVHLWRADFCRTARIFFFFFFFFYIGITSSPEILTSFVKFLTFFETKCEHWRCRTAAGPSHFNPSPFCFPFFLPSVRPPYSLINQSVHENLYRASSLFPNSVLLWKSIRVRRSCPRPTRLLSS